MSKSDPPQPPNPQATAAAQTGTNVSTAIANAFLNNTNQTTPLGSLSYDQTGSYQFTDPSNGQVYNIPRFTATQQLTDQSRAIQDETEAAKFNLSGLANTQSARVGSLLSNDIDLSQAGPFGDPSQIAGIPRAATSFGDAGAQQLGLGPYGQQATGFGGAGDVTRNYGPQDDFSSDRQRVEQSLFSRLSPQLERERTNLEQRLADQGIRYGSTAYNDAMKDYNDRAAAQQVAVTQAGGAEQQRMMDMAAQRAGFQNAAQQQEYQQQLGRGQFTNAAQAQQFQELLGAGGFTNAAQQNAFQQAALRGQFGQSGLAQQVQQAQATIAAQNNARAQYLQEQYALRNQPINEISALLSGSQVQQPSFMNTPQQQIPTTDVAGLINQNFAQQFQNYQTQQQAQNQLLGGILGAGSNLGAAAIRFSDRRMKENVHRLGSVFAAEPQPVEEPEKKKLPIYSFSYRDDPSSTRHVGPMAQDVEEIDPGAVGEDRRGMKFIDTRRVMGSILRAA